jgi:glycosyltransferase involved in cell wall biosynthesis
MALPNISVIIPTRNPREDYLQRVLDALRVQTLPKEQWELLLIDNASTKPVAECFDLSWHPAARVLIQTEAGLTPSRLMGISESRSELLVFVDDDNVLAENYLQTALQITGERSYLGAWSGNVVPEFEVQPEKFLEPYLWCLCIRDVPTDRWGNTGDPSTTPWGAGMCVRYDVGKQYAQRVASSKVSAALGRSGALPRGANDLDLALTSFDLGLGVGVFANLSLTHLLPAQRLTPDNILKTIETGTASNHVLLKARGTDLKQDGGWVDRLVTLYKEMRGSPFQRKVAAARRRAVQHAESLMLTK